LTLQSVTSPIGISADAGLDRAAQGPPAYVAGNEAEARTLVYKMLRRRGTAKNRIGVAYRFRELIDPGRWLSIAAE
jgi:hypothetical protein